MAIIAQIVYNNQVFTFPDMFGGENVDADVYINLSDPATNNPTDGNGTDVQYFIDSVDGHAIIMGQSYLIFSGRISESNYNDLGMQTSYWSKVFALGTVIPGSTPPVDNSTPGVCDLAIQNIIIRRETITGANDAAITVVATSSFGGITYSLDNATFQSNPVFGGLGSISGTVYVTDSNECTASMPFTIPSPDDLLVSTPAITMTNGNISRWNAAFNPVNFIYQRKDAEVISVDSYTIINQGTFAQIHLNVDVSIVKAGDIIYVNAGGYKGTYTVLQLGSSSGAIVLNTAYTISATGFANINRLRPYYHVITRINYVDPVSGQLSVITSTNTPDNSGYIKADISSFLQSLLKIKDGSDYSLVNYRDDNLSASYQVSYAETWDGHTPVYKTLVDPFYVVYAANQLQSKYAGNLALYVPHVLNSAAKWVTDFAVPVYNNDLPFDIGFIYGEQLAGRQLYYVLKQYDINQNQINVNDITSYLLNEDGSFLLNQDGSKLVIARQDLYNTPIAEHIGLNRLLIDQSFDEDVYYFSVQLFYDEDTTPVPVTESQMIRIDQEIQLNDVYLRWIGLTGCWNYYRFYFNQEVSLDVQNAITIKRYVLDWAGDDTIEDVISKMAGEKIKLETVDTSVADIKGLQSIKYSPKVQMLVGKNPVKWQTVVVAATTFAEYETRNWQAPFVITINLPTKNVQFQ